MKIKTARIAITVVWVAGALPLLLILIMRQLNAFYTPDPNAAWTWAAQFLFPNLTLIAGAWSVTALPGENKPIGSAIVFWGAIVLSVFHLAVLYLVLGAQASGGANWKTIFEQSGLFLGLIQALVIGWLGKFFIESQR